MIINTIKHGEESAGLHLNRSIRSPEFHPVRWGDSALLEEKLPAPSAEDVIQRELPALLENADNLTRFLNDGGQGHFVVPRWFTDQKPDCFESPSDIKVWETAMAVGLGRADALDDHVQLAVKGLIVDTSTIRNVRKARRVLVYPASTRWADDPQVVTNEIVMKESLLAHAPYRLRVYGFPSVSSDALTVDYDILLMFLMRQHDVMDEARIRNQIELAQSDDGSLTQAEVRRLFSTLYPRKITRFFCGESISSQMYTEFQQFFKQESEWRVAVNHARVILKTLQARGCEPYKISHVRHSIMAEALYLLIQAEGLMETITFSRHIVQQYDLCPQLLEKLRYDDLSRYQLEPELFSSSVHQRPLPSDPALQLLGP